MPMKKFNRNMRRAIEVSKHSCFTRARVGAVVADEKGNVLAESCNIQKTHPLQRSFAVMAANIHNEESMTNKIFLHAEIAAIIAAAKNGNPYTIYVARTLRNGNCALAKPCEICSMAIKSAGIKNIVYTNDCDEGFSYTVVEI